MYVRNGYLQIGIGITVLDRYLAVYSGGRKTIKVTFRVKADSREC
jgi:hypothetical protein